MGRTKLLAALTAVALLAGCAVQGPPTASSEPPAASSQGAVSSAAPEEKSPAVAVDWSKLNQDKTRPMPDVDGGRWYANETLHLPAGAHYGPLLPYVGGMAQQVFTWTDEQGVEQSQLGWNSAVYGLMTREGKIVTDPAYQSVDTVQYRSPEGWTKISALALGQARPEWEEVNNGLRYALAAGDGSWVTDFEFWNYTAREDELMLYGPAGLTWMDAATGYRADWSWEFLGVDTQKLPELTMELQWLYGFNWLEEGIYLGRMEEEGNSSVRVFHPETAQVVELTMEAWEQALDRYMDIGWAADTWWDLKLSEEGTSVTFTRGEEEHTIALPQKVKDLGYDAKGDVVALTVYDSTPGAWTSACAWLFDLTSGELLLEGRDISLTGRQEDFDALGAVILRHGDGSTTYYDDHVRELFTLSGDADNWVYATVEDGLLTTRDDQTFFACYDLEKGEFIFYRNLGLGE